VKSKFLRSVSLLIAQVLLAARIAAATYYVSGTGSDRNNGLSAAAPLCHLQNAANRTRPGDTVMVMNGTYTPPGKVFYNSGGNDRSVVYDFNLLFSTGIKAGRFGSPLGPHDIVADPNFVATARGDFRLKAGSPAIDSGTASLAPSSDFAGNRRPTGTGFDRGAYEFQP
jgi:hypothetical protein